MQMQTKPVTVGLFTRGPEKRTAAESGRNPSTAAARSRRNSAETEHRQGETTSGDRPSETQSGPNPKPDVIAALWRMPKDFALDLTKPECVE